MSHLEEVFLLATQQHGVFGTFQLKQLGVEDGSRYHLLKNPVFICERRGVYALNGSQNSWSRRAMVNVLSSGQNALLSHESALINLGLLNQNFVTFRKGRKIEFHVTLPRESRRRMTSAMHRSIYKKELFEKTIVNSIPQVPVEIALIESARHLPEQFCGSVIDTAIRNQLTTARKIRNTLDQLWPAPGRSKSRVEEIIGGYLSDSKNFAKSESVLEARILRIVSDVFNDEIATQHQVFIAGSRYRIDIAIPSKMVAIEVDGFEFHNGRDVFDKDKKRQNDLVVAGWTVLRFTATQPDEEIRSQILRCIAMGRFCRLR